MSREGDIWIKMNIKPPKFLNIGFPRRSTCPGMNSLKRAEYFKGRSSSTSSAIITLLLTPLKMTLGHSWISLWKLSLTTHTIQHRTSNIQMHHYMCVVRDALEKWEGEQVQEWGHRKFNKHGDEEMLVLFSLHLSRLGRHSAHSAVLNLMVGKYRSQWRLYVLPFIITMFLKFYLGSKHFLLRF